MSGTAARPVPEPPAGVTVNGAPVMLDAAAVQRVAKLAEAEGGGYGLFVGVRSGGCSGFSYELYFQALAEAADLLQGTCESDGVSVTVLSDPQSAPLLAGAVVSFVDGLQAGFRITNPSATRTCGCGSSFS